MPVSTDNVEVYPVRTAKNPSHTFYALFDVVKRRWGIFATVTLTVTALVILFILLQTPQYEASARVKLDPRQPDVGTENNGGMSNPDQSLVDTEVGVISSRDLADDVAARLHLSADPSFVSPGTSGKQIERAVVDHLLANLTVTREKSSYIVDITYKAVDANRAALIANAFATGYINNNVGQRTSTAAQSARLLEQQAVKLADQVQQANARVAQYRVSTGIVQGVSGGTSVDEQIATLTSQLATEEAAAAAAQSRAKVAQQQLGSGDVSSIGSVINSQAIAQLRAQRADIVRDMGEVNTRYGPKHPAAVRVAEQLRAVDQQILEESRHVVDSLVSDARAATASADSLRHTLATLKSQQVSDSRAIVVANDLQKQADSQRSIYEQAVTQEERANQAASNFLPRAQIIEQAAPPAYPTSPKRALLSMLGLVLAISLGTVTITVQELLARGFMTAAALEEAIGLRVLGIIPLYRKRNRSQSPADALIEHPMTAFAEAVRSLRSALLLARPTNTEPGPEDANPGASVLAIVSAMPGEGKTTTSLSLARIMAQAGERVVLIDCDTRRADLRRFVTTEGSASFVDVLRGDAELSAAIVADVVEGLDLLPVLAPSFETRDLFTSDRITPVLAYLRQRYDQIVLDAPPMIGVADTRRIVQLADAVLLVVKWNATPAETVGQAARWLVEDKAPIVGTALTMVDPRTEAAGAAYYGQEYAAYYRD